MAGIILISFLYFVTPEADGQILLPEHYMAFDNTNSVCYGPGTHGQFRPSCLNNESVIADPNFYSGAKATVKACPESVTKLTNHSGSYLVDNKNISAYVNETACCLPDEDNDCFLKYTSADSGLDNFYRNCSGYSECQSNFDVPWLMTNCDTTIYPSRTHYFYMRYTCIESKYMYNMCSNKSFNETRRPFYLITPRYPNSVKSDIEFCKCKIHMNGGNISFYWIDIRLQMFHNDCKQWLNVTHAEGTTEWDCDSAPRFNVTRDNFKAPVTVTLYNALNEDGGHVMIGIYVHGEVNENIKIDCHSTQTTTPDASIYSQITKSVDDLANSRDSTSTETVSYPIGESTSVSGSTSNSFSGGRRESESTMQNKPSSSFSTVTDINDFTGSTVKNSFTETTVKGRNGLDEIANTGQTSLTGSAIGERATPGKIDTDSTSTITTLKTQLYSFHHTVRIENNETKVYIIFGIGVGIVGLLLSIWLIVKFVTYCNRIQIRPDARNGNEDNRGHELEEHHNPGQDRILPDPENTVPKTLYSSQLENQRRQRKSDESSSGVSSLSDSTTSHGGAACRSDSMTSIKAWPNTDTEETEKDLLNNCTESTPTASYNAIHELDDNENNDDSNDDNLRGSDFEHDEWFERSAVPSGENQAVSLDLHDQDRNHSKPAGKSKKKSEGENRRIARKKRRNKSNKKKRK